ncbi:MAG: hypothetical protein JWM28_2171 [Chitinophagaceae bacterium]|nr:hypothetical protein [Chitinophagaceae bacterium]
MPGKIVLVAGSTSPIGLPVVHYFLKAGATVIAPVKSLDEITKLKASVADISTGTLITQLTELPDYDTGFDITETIVEKFGRIDIGIAIFNGLTCNNQLTEVHINEWQNMVDNEVTPFFICARLILRTMKVSKGGLYISLCDSSLVKQDNFPPLSKIAANIKMEMSKIFAEETKKYNVKYYHLWVKQDDRSKEFSASGQDVSVISSEMIGSHIMKLYLCKTDKPDEVFQLFPENYTL